MELQADDLLYKLIVEASPSGLLLVDEAGTIVMANPCVLTQFGYSEAELLGQSVEILVPGPAQAIHRTHRTGYMQEPQARAMGRGRELYGVRKDGSEFPVEIGLTPLQVNGRMYVLASVVDITERRRLEEQLRRTERIAELGTLASGMAHEIGTPMNVILGRAEYLLERVTEEPIKKSLQIIVTQVERITRVMNQLLAFARRRPVDRRPVDLRETIEGSLEMFQERLARHGIRIEKSFRDDCPKVRADADQMSQVFINLVMNAIHAMPEGGTLRVGLTRSNGTVRLTVADTGHGIAQQDLAKIFDPFFTTKETGKGTGLGLTVVKGIIEEHGGSIQVESEPGKGTTFTISLPVSQ
ncbi:MAG: ATP-binding protein [Nitrospirota bacterium]